MRRIFTETPVMIIYKDSYYEDAWEFSTTLENETEIRDHLNKTFDFKGAISFGKITITSHKNDRTYGYVEIILAFEIKEVDG